eukprot:524793-Prorocentrum_minimum.AAC.1
MAGRPPPPPLALVPPYFRRSIPYTPIYERIYKRGDDARGIIAATVAAEVELFPTCRGGTVSNMS